MSALIFFSYERHNSLFCWTTCVGAYNTASWKCVIAWKCEMWANVCTYWSSPEQLGISTSKAFRGCVWWGTSINWFLVAGSLSHWLTNFNCLLLYSASKPMQSKCAVKWKWLLQSGMSALTGGSSHLALTEPSSANVIDWQDPHRYVLRTSSVAQELWTDNLHTTLLWVLSPAAPSLSRSGYFCLSRNS